MSLERLLVLGLITFLFIVFWGLWQGYKAWLVGKIMVSQAELEKPTLLYFTADYCGVCKFQQTPIIEQLGRAFGDKIAIQTINVVDEPELARTYQVMTLPTIVVLNQEGQVLELNYGMTQANKLVQQLNLSPV